MTAVPHPRLEALFAEAVARPADQRAAFVAAACGDDAALRHELERLLRADEAGDAPIVDAIGRAAARVVAGGEDREAPAVQFGPYRVTGELGRGGMGVVWRAARADGAYDMDVAIKVVRGGALDADAMRRFHEERRILATLEHPNIARLLDAGTAADGDPFIVIELVHGVPIDDYCARHGLDLPARLRLFLKVCRAVAHAHGRLIVHRDLKPANIVVSDEGEPKLLDFGIAKLLAPDAAPAASPETISPHRRMTPEYASPEQLLGEPLGATSDVYSLGTVLFELLAGRRPFAGRAGTGELERAVLAGAPPKPSTVVTTPGPATDARRLRRRLEGDLDNIVLKAIAREPARRYESVAAFADDLMCFLDGRPVTARPASAGYRAAKFVARHRLGLATGLVAVAAFVVLAALHTVRLGEERDLARAERDKAHRVTELVSGIFELAEPNATGETITARAILDRAAQRLPAELADQPALLAEMLTVIGKVYERLGLYEQARHTLMAALDVRERAFGVDDPSAPDTLCALAPVVHELATTAAAVPFAERCLAIRERTLAPDDPKRAEALFALGNLHAQSRALTRERELLEKALAIQQRAVPPDDRALGATLNALGAVYSREVGREQAYDAWRRAVEAYDRAGGPGNPIGMDARYNACFGLRSLERRVESADCSGRLVALVERTLAPGHPERAKVFMLHSHALAAVGRFDETLVMRERALDEFSRAYGADDWRVGASHRVLADMLTGIGRLDEAREHLRHARTVLQPHAERQPREWLMLLHGQAQFEFESALAAPAARPRFERFVDAADAALARHAAAKRSTTSERTLAHVLAAQRAAARGDGATVRAEVVAAAAEPDGWTSPDASEGRMRMILAWALAATGTFDGARVQAEEGLRLFEAARSTAWLRTRYAVKPYLALAEAGDPDGARRVREAVPSVR